MGLPFDIGLVNAMPRQAYEIRDVLRKMRDAGDILFIGERQQLVFHVVPQPSRLGYFTDVYTRALGAPGAANGTPVEGFPVPGTPVELSSGAFHWRPCCSSLEASRSYPSTGGQETSRIPLRAS